MKIFLPATLLLAALSVTPAFIAPARADSPVPCEKALSDLRAAAGKATLSDADKAKIKELEDKGIERCNADDDKRADDFFAQAMKIVAK